MAFEEFKKANSSKEVKKLEGPSLQEILSDPNTNDLFSIQMQSSSEKSAAALAKVISKENLTANDFSYLEDERKKFNERMGTVSHLENIINSVSFDEIINFSPELKKIGNQLSDGTGTIKDIYIKHLEYLAFKNPNLFANAQSGFNKFTKSQESLKEEQKRFEETIASMGKVGVPAKSWYEALSVRDSTERKKLLKDLARQAKGLGFRPSTRRNEVLERLKVLEKRDEIEAFIMKERETMKKMGNIVADTILNFPDLNKELIALFRKERTEAPVKGMTFEEMKDNWHTIDIVKKTILNDSEVKKIIATNEYKNGDEEMKKKLVTPAIDAYLARYWQKISTKREGTGWAQFMVNFIRQIVWDKLK